MLGSQSVGVGNAESGEMGSCSSMGVFGFEKYVPGSTKSGGRRSFSISDLRASSKLVMASLIPSAPSTRVPYGSLPDPETFLSSETLSDSSLKEAVSYEKVSDRNRNVP